MRHLPNRWMRYAVRPIRLDASITKGVLYGLRLTVWGLVHYKASRLCDVLKQTDSISILCLTD